MAYLYFKFRLYPTKDQAVQFEEQANHCRFVYNKCLEMSIKEYETTGKFLLGFSLQNLLPDLKKEFDWLKSSNSQSLQVTTQNLAKSFKNRFLHKSGGFPKFKSKRSSSKSFCVPQGFKLQKNRIKLPKLGWIEMRQSRKFQGKIKSITIKKDVDIWYASFLCEYEAPEQIIDQTSIVGLDVGIKTFLTTSDGEVFEMTKYQSEEKNLKRKQRKLSKKSKDSKNRARQRVKVARQYRKIRRKKENLVNNIVASITKTYDIVSCENLNIKGMKKNKKLSRAIHKNPWGQLFSKLEKKAKDFRLVDRWYPSSKTCSECGWIHKDLTLGDRIFECQECGLEVDRDLNAAINLRNYNTVATAGIKACGESSVGAGSSDPTSHDSEKQESETTGSQSIKSLD